MKSQLFCLTLLAFGGVAVAHTQRISASSDHVLKANADGTVWAWGSNLNGKLGDGTLSNRPVLVQVVGLTDIVAVSAATFHSLALKSDGTVWAWGANSYGQLGNGTTLASPIPLRVATVSDGTAIAAGESGNLVVRRDGSVLVWGTNIFGELRPAIRSNAISAVPVAFPTLTNIVAAALSPRHGLALRSDGVVLSWGASDWVLLGGLEGGSAHELPAPVPGLSGVAAIAAEAYHSLAVKSDGSVWGWGYTYHGELGHDASGANQVPPGPLLALSQVEAACAADSLSVFLRQDGSVWSIGSNALGQLGTGDLVASETPVPSLASGPFQAIACGPGSAFALGLDGVVQAWGASAGLGIGAADHRSTPALAPFLAGVVKVIPDASLGQGLTITYDLQFKPAFAAQKDVFARASDLDGNLVQWKRTGSWIAK